MYAIVKYFLTDIESEVGMGIAEVCTKEADAEEILATEVEDDFTHVGGMYDKVFREWEWDMLDVQESDPELYEKLAEYYCFYHIKICEI